MRIINALRYLFQKAKKLPVGHKSNYADGTIRQKISDTGKKKDWKIIGYWDITKKEGKKHGTGTGKRPPGPTGRTGKLPGTVRVEPGKADGSTEKNLSGKRPGADVRKPLYDGGKVGVGHGGNLRGGLTPEKQKAANRQILELVAQKGPEGTYTPQEKDLLRMYTGAGGGLVDMDVAKIDPRSFLTAYFTPDRIVQSMWNITEKYVGKNARVLEPSAGVGRFADGKNTHKIDMIEVDAVTATINKILHSEDDGARVNFGRKEPMMFEELFFDGSRPKEYSGPIYDAVVGNPPFADYKGKYGRLMPKVEKPETMYEYFINKGLDTLRPGGVLAYLVPSNWLRGKSTNLKRQKLKKLIAGKAKLVEAYRLANEGVFHASDLGTDIVVFRKDADGMSPDLLADDTYFKAHPDHVVAEQISDPETGRPYIPGSKTPDMTKKPILDRYSKPYPGGYLKGTVEESMNKMDQISRGIQPAPDRYKETQFASPELRQITGIVTGDKPQPSGEELSQAMLGNKNAVGPHRRKKITLTETEKKIREKGPKHKYTLDEFISQYNLEFDEKDIGIWKHIGSDSSIDLSKVPFDGHRMNWINGKAYHNTIFASGNIYQKLRSLEEQKDDIVANHGMKQFEKQRKILIEAMPEKKTVKQINISPISPLADIINFVDEESGTEYNLKNAFTKWAGVEYGDFLGNVTKFEVEAAGISWKDVMNYIHGEPVVADRVRGSDYASDKEAAAAREEAKEKADEIRRRRRDLAERLFDRFIKDGLTDEEREKVEEEYNRRFNAIKSLDCAKIPVYVDGLSKTFKGKPLEIRGVQLEGVAFAGTKGSGIIAYDVGVGKTMAGILSAIQSVQRGWAKKPLIIVPKGVYQKWINEIEDLFPDIKVNRLKNLRDLGENPYSMIQDGTISVATYESLEMMRLNQDDYDAAVRDMADSMAMPKEYGEKKAGKTEAQEANQNLLNAEERISGAEKNAVYEFDKFGFDHITIDEAHNFKNIFGRAKAGTKASKQQGKQARGSKEKANEFAKLTGGESDRAARIYMLSRAIQRKNSGRNVVSLTATPFTNSPIEMYNMLSTVAKDRLNEMGLDNMNAFLSTFAEIKTEWGVSGDNKIKMMDVVKGFKNVGALQSLIRDHIDFRMGEDIPDIKNSRPKKTVIPVMLAPTEIQKAIRLREEFRYTQAKTIPGAALVAINNQRMSNLSPKLVMKEGVQTDETPIGEEYREQLGGLHVVKDSPKLKFTTDVAANIHREFPSVGQVIYMPHGIDSYSEIIDYFTKEHGIPKSHIGFIKSEGMSDDKKEKVKNDFNDPESPLKILIGSRTILEGVDLQRNSAVLYQTFLDWNPSASRQLHGRVWRQGNAQPEAFIVTPLITDSIDSAMYQKHDEKQKRFSDIQSYRASESDTMAVDDINPESMKWDLITDPVKRAGFKLEQQKQGLREEWKFANMRSEEWKQRKKNYNSIMSEIKDEEESIKENEEELSSEQSESWQNSLKKRIKQSRSQIKRLKGQLATHDRKMADAGITIDTIDEYIAGFEASGDKALLAMEKMSKNLDAMIAQEIEAEKKKPKADPLETTIDQYSKDLIGRIRENQKHLKKEYLEKARVRGLLDQMTDAGMADGAKVEFMKSAVSEFSLSRSGKVYMILHAFAGGHVSKDRIWHVEKLFSDDADAMIAIGRVKEYAKKES